ncbi:MAG: 6-phosphogluconate dehydrogenase [Nocardioides sp.]|jgi:3-hydroxyisobutyrate dehydrogenase-like beta-hydroxyacid dehydrogenase|nr:6-phosphogluconate dehydrogenase [Nocardioides sp.]
MNTFGIIGLGRMGSSLARALLAQGVVVHGQDRDADTAAAASSDGVTVHDDPASLCAAVDVLVTSLPTVDAVVSCLTELAPHVRAGTLVLETSTCAPEHAAALAPVLEARGATFVDCPVSRKAPHMTMLVGGPPGVLGESAAALELVSDDLVYCGRLGGGYAVKLLNQYVKYSRFLAASEALLFARGEGLDANAVLRGLLSGTGAEAGLGTAEEFFTGDREAIERHAPTDTIVKDVELARRMLGGAGFRSPTFDALAEFFLAAGVTDLHDRPYPESASLLEAFRYAARKDS